MVETKTYAEELRAAAIDKSSGFAPTCRGESASVGVEMGFKLGAAWDRAWVIAWLLAQAESLIQHEQSDHPSNVLRILAADLEEMK